MSAYSAAALADVTEVVEQLQVSLMKVENFQKLLELKKDLLGVDNLVVPGRVRLKLRTLYSFPNLRFRAFSNFLFLFAGVHQVRLP